MNDITPIPTMSFFRLPRPSNARRTGARLLAVGFFFCLGTLAHGQDGDARAIFDEVERRQQAVRSESVSIDMQIVDSRGRTRSRSMRTYTRQGADGRGRSLIVFTGPADIRGMGLLTIETDEGDDQRLYLPSLGRVQRIAGSKRQDRFAGSDFAYEDLGSYDPEDFETRLTETTNAAWTLDARSLDRDSQYGRLLLTVDRQRYVVLEVEYFDRDGDLVKRLTANDFVETVPGTWQPGSLTMEDLREDRKTVLTFTDRDTQSSLSDDLFTERQLRRGLP